MSRRGVVVGTVAALAAPALAASADADPVLELRQYKIVPHQRDAFVRLFEREFVDSQEDLGMRLMGQFRDMDDPDRFTWLRGFPLMASRAEKLGAFYSGPVWQAHRAEANPMLDDNDNVLLLKPSSLGAGLGASERPPVGAARRGFVVATIHYLWKAPGEGFSPFFETTGRARLERAGLNVLGSYVGEQRPNDFPRLPVRQGEKVFVWFGRVDDMAGYERATAAMRGTAGVMRRREWLMPNLEERPAQVLRLNSTPRSRL